MEDRSSDAAGGGNFGERRYRRQRSGGSGPADISCGGNKQATKRGSAGADDGAGRGF